jgi:hypothetical protein
VGNEAVGPLPLDVDAWDAWSPAEAQRHLDGVDTPWYVAAGWALDLFLGRPTRAHQDLEIGVPADRFGEVRAALDDLEFVVIGEGQAWPIAESTLAAHRQTWGRERSGGPWRIDVFREQWKGDEWTYDRNRRIRMPAEDLISYTVEGIPFAQPEVVLLLKARTPRAKDATDFATVLPHLNADQRRWLHDALTLVHPGHPWLEALEG